MFFNFTDITKQACLIWLCLFFLFNFNTFSQPSDAFFDLKKDQPTEYKKLYSEGIKVLLNPQIDKAEETIEEIEEFIDAPGTSEYLKCRAYLLISMIEARYENNFSAFRNFRKAHSIYKENKDLDEKYALPGGLMHLTLSSVPKKYAWILDILGLNGSKETGIKLIDQASENKESFEGREARLIYPLIANYFLQDQALARKKADQLNLESNLDLIVFLISNSKARGGNAIVANINKFDDEVFKLFPPAYFLIGETFLRKGDYAMARNHLNIFRNKQSSNEYLSAANLNIFLSFYLNNQIDEGKRFLSTVDYYSEKTEADRYANEYLKNFDFDSENYKMIWKLRLATDGGFDRFAQNIIDKDPDFKKREHQTEWIYRKARFFHNTGDIEKAKNDYLSIISLQKDNNWYYAPNSCIQLARIYLEEDHPDKAKLYLNKIKSYNNYPYQESIEYEANLISREIKNEQ
ncbi:tetratricopeptide repeat protein [Mangrovivirga cuniculi]|uniref:Tetratricopeptide repeat protein n=1 Tax=Mangrovivirga cuniculi TaxID=2715131 RepID=A0A4D7JJR6_9BACT|nr:hypothetical protein [Mangrovivirga cuniculi]QCK15841.1 hypothetical protein DCC35_14345 [Mangrovivirga cuniculi]